MENDANTCILCDRTLDQSKLPIVITRYQSAAIAHVKTVSRKRKDKKWLKLKNLTAVKLHKSCYCSYVKDRSVEVAQKRLRSRADLQAQEGRKKLRSAVVKNRDDITDEMSDAQNTDLQAHNSTELDIEAINNMGVHFIMQADEDETKKPSSSTLQNRGENTDVEIELPQHFDIKAHCFICGRSADDAYIAMTSRVPTDKRAKRQVHFVSKDQTKDNMLKFIQEHSENYYMKAIKDRIENVNLVNGRYHGHCMKTFYKTKKTKVCNNIIGHSVSENA